MSVLTVFIVGYAQAAGSHESLSDGGAVYVSIYLTCSQVRGALILSMASMLSMRNTDPEYPITITQADYFSSDGKRLVRHIKDPQELAPLASSHTYIREKDSQGGPGANFVVKWRAEKKVNQTIMEGIMLGLTSGQGVSFVSPGRVIETHQPDHAYQEKLLMLHALSCPLYVNCPASSVVFSGLFQAFWPPRFCCLLPSQVLGG